MMMKEVVSVKALKYLMKHKSGTNMINKKYQADGCLQDTCYLGSTVTESQKP